MKPEIDYDAVLIDDVAGKIVSELSFILPPSQRNEIHLSLRVAYKHGKAAGIQEAIELIRDAT